MPTIYHSDKKLKDTNHRYIVHTKLVSINGKMKYIHLTECTKYDRKGVYKTSYQAHIDYLIGLIEKFPDELLLKEKHYHTLDAIAEFLADSDNPTKQYLTERMREHKINQLL